MATADTQQITLEADVAALIDVLLSEEFNDQADGSLSSTGLTLYAQQVGKIVNTANDAGLPGLEYSASLLQQQVSDLAIIGASGERERELLEEWPSHVMGYLAAPTDPSNGQALLDHLLMPSWPTPLTEQEQLDLREMLQGDMAFAAPAPVESAPLIEPIEITTVAATTPFDQTDDELVASTENAVIVEPEPKALEALADELAFATDEELPDLNDAAVASADDISFEQALETLDETLFEDLLPLDETASDNSVSVNATEAITESAVSAVLAADHDDIALAPAITSVSELESDQQSESLQDQVAALMDVLMPLLESSEPAAQAQVIADYQQQLGRIGTAAADADQFGLHDLAMLLQEQVGGLGEQGQSCSDEQLQLLEEWPALVMGYLETPQDADIARELTHHLLNPAWPQALSEDAADPELLIELLTTPSAESADQSEASVSENYDTASPEVPTEALSDSTFAEDAVAPTETTSEAVEELTTESAPAEAEATGSTINPDLLDIIKAEIAEIVETGAESLDQAAAAESSREQRQQALEAYSEELERLAMAAESIGLGGLGQICAQIQTNLGHFSAQDSPLSPVQRSLLEDWPEPVLAYLEAIEHRPTATALAQHIAKADWPEPFTQAATAEVIEQLLSPSPSLEEFGEIAERQKVATADDVSLALPEDLNPELLDSLLQELPNQTAEFSAAIEQILGGTGTMADVSAAQRIAHTVKGAANTVGVTGIANLTHHVEDILIALGKEHSLPTKPLAETLMDCADCLETMSETLLGLSEPPSQALAVLQEVLDWANSIDHQGIPTGDEIPVATVVATTDEETTPTAAEAATPTAAEETVPAAAEAATTATQADVDADADAQVAVVRVAAPLIDELLRLVGESIILTGQIEERMRVHMEQAKTVRAQNQVLQQHINEIEQLVDVQGVGMPSMATTASGQFDPLEMDQYNELHTVTRHLVESAADAQALDEGIAENFTALETLLINQTQLHRESQETVLRTRMVPIKSIAPRLHRTVRQASRLTDKDAELIVKGVETMIDSNVLSDMMDPLMHILRNAVDHGIETPEQRQKLGKPATGRITLSFSRDGSNVVVRCQDDGAGLNLAAIRRTAEQRGVVSPGEELSDDELSRLILRPGFSTRTATTQVSGRGIGMDVVYTQILKIKGSLSIGSEAGQGTHIDLRLPTTLISTHALLVHSQGQLLAISDRSIDQIVYAGSGQIHRSGEQLTFRLDDEDHPVNLLDQLLGYPIDPTIAELDNHPVLMARDETGTLRAVFVEDVVDSRDMVVKNTGLYAPKMRGALGATILGDGSVTAVLDLADLLRDPGDAVTHSAPLAGQNSRVQKPTVLVVDDSLSVRRSMQQVLKDAGFEVETARDGLEAVAILNKQRPDIMLVDMEMPRMNGLELTYHARAQTETKDVPIIMITSRSTEKHRAEAKAAGVSQYLTKPVLEDELLSQIGQALK